MTTPYAYETPNGEPLAIYLGNDHDVHRVEVKNRGALVTGVTLTAYLATMVDEVLTPIHASLEVTLDELAPGDFIGTLQGDAITDHVGPLLDEAEAAGNRLVVYEVVTVGDGDYQDVLELPVERIRPARLPS